MDIQFSLKDIHKYIFISMHALKISTSTEIKIAVYLLSASEYEYLKLLKKVVDDGVYKKPPEKSNFLFSTLEFIFFLRKKGIIETATDKEITKSIEFLEALELIKTNPIYSIEKDSDGKEVRKFSHSELFLTEEGVRIAERILEGRRPIIRLPQSVRSDIFIASAFGYEEIDLLFENEFKPACEEIGYKPLRVDLSEPIETITEAILRGIQKCECLIADLTFARPSVYFEIGFAHGLGIPVILTCRKDHFKGQEEALKVHFDLEQYKISYWENAANGRVIWFKNMSPLERLKVLINLKNDLADTS
jgi:hypothetical protein